MAVYSVRRETIDQERDVTIYFSEDDRVKLTHSLGRTCFDLQDEDQDIVRFSTNDLGYLIKALQKLQEVIVE